MKKIEIQMRKGILEYIVLLILCKDELYGRDILKKIKLNGLDIVEGTLYPLLNRLKKDGLVSSYLKESSLGPARKYYRITTGGLETMLELKKSYEKMDKIIKNLLDNKGKKC